MDILSALLRSGRKVWLDPNELVFYEEAFKRVRAPKREWVPPTVVTPATRPEVIEVTGRRTGSTDFINIHNAYITSPYTLFSVEYPGKLYSVSIITDSENYEVSMAIDDSAYTFSYVDLKTYSYDIEGVSAFKNDLGYVLSLKDIEWVSRFFMSVRPLGAEMTILRAVGKYATYP